MVRFKNRWLLVEFLPEASTASVAQDSKAIWNALRQSVISNFGDIGWGSVALSLNVKYFSPTTNTAIIRVAREQHKIAWGGVTLLSAIEGRKCLPNVICVSGTIKHAQMAAIVHNREVVARYRALAKLPATYRDSYDVLLEANEREIEALRD